MVEREAFRQTVGDVLGIVGFLVVVGGAGIVTALFVAVMSSEATLARVESGLLAGFAWLVVGGVLLLIGRRLTRRPADGTRV